MTGAGGYERIYSAFELIQQYGERVTDRRCTCCNQFTLYAIRYPDSRGTALLCSLCDVEHDKRQSS